ncbi:MAG: hypothetical protein HYX68_03960 [Planctomycetes bacterium]|nr:hypothetical protein [Planctomycetota bacterium]
MMRILTAFLSLVAVLPAPALACSLCGSSLARSTSLVFEYSQSTVVIYGTLANPRFVGNPGLGRGTTEFHIKRVIKGDAAFSRKNPLTLSRYLPVLDPKAPPTYVMFIRDPKKNLEPHWGKEITSPAVLDFVARLDRLRDEPEQMLLTAAKAFDHADSDIADEAFLLFAKADDKLITKVAPKLSPGNLRKLVKDRDLAPERMSMFAYLLGACGNADDAELLRSLLKNPPARFYKSFEGILAGYITMRPKEGWTAARGMLSNPKESFLLRYATLRTMRFFYNASPKENEAQVLDGLNLALGQTDLADIAIQDLRKWKRWEHTKKIIAAWDQKDFQTPIIQQNIIRYALACPLPEAKTVVARARRQDPELVRDLEQELK